MTDYRREDIDVLKGIAVVGVFLYHFGICRSGYLGVDVFLVISGFLTIPKIVRMLERGRFQYGAFLKSRLVRLWPLTILVTLVSLLIGYFVMMPADYQNLVENALATFFFANNLLQCFLGGNYWDVRNEFKPLMHTWYLGVLFEFYLCLPLLLMLAWYFLKKNKNRVKILLAVCTLISFLLFLFPVKPLDPFYFLYARLFEFTLGGLAGLGIEKGRAGRRKYLPAYPALTLVILAGLFLMTNDNTPAIGAHVSIKPFLLQNKLFLPLTVLLTQAALYAEPAINGKWRILQYFGTRSFGIYLWQQPIFAFYRYLLNPNPTVAAFLGCMALTLLLSEVSYRWIEQKPVFQKHVVRKAFLIASIASIFCVIVYKNAGVVRDVPELDVKVAQVPAHFNSAYIDRIYACRADFEDKTSGKNVLLVGNSFARDFGNILLESAYGEHLNIAYYPDFEAVPIRQLERCDYLFTFGYKSDIPRSIRRHLPDENHIYGIGTKNFGVNNGYVYARRYRKDYFETTVPLSESYVALNEEWKKEWGDQYIDLIKPVEAAEGRVHVFTPEHKFFSHDCRHLTKAGASYYAQVLPFDRIFADTEQVKR